MAKTRSRRSTLIQRSRRIAPAEKAAYHQLTGAGRRQVKRQFLGLSSSDEAAIVARVAAHLDRAVK